MRPSAAISLVWLFCALVSGACWYFLKTLMDDVQQDLWWQALAFGAAVAGATLAERSWRSRRRRGRALRS